MEEDDMVMRVGSSLMIERERDEPMRRGGLQARGIYKEVPRPSRRLALATRQKIPYRKTPSQTYGGTAHKYYYSANRGTPHAHGP
jgi:hypothetical protein